MEIFGQRLGRGALPHGAQVAARDPLSALRGAELCHWPTSDRNHDLLASLCSAQNLTHVVAQLLLRDSRHNHKVAEVLPVVGPHGLMQLVALNHPPAPSSPSARSKDSPCFSQNAGPIPRIPSNSSRLAGRWRSVSSKAAFVATV